MYTIKNEHYKVYIGYFFTEDEFKYMTPKIDPEHTEVHILKLHSVIELNNDKVICELDIETMSYDESDEANNVCWENSIIQMLLKVLLPVYK